ECFLWGDAEQLPWLSPPPIAAWERGRELLEELGALDTQGRPTAKGRDMARMGLEPRLAALCVEASPLALGCAVVLSDRDAPGLGEDADFRERLSLLRRGGAGGASAAWVSRARELALDLLQRLGRKNFAWSVEDEADAGELLARAFPDRIGCRRDSPVESRRGGIEGVYRFAGGREGLLTGPLAASPWIVAPEIDAGERMGIIRMAAPISSEGALEILKNRITLEYEVVWKEPLKELVPRSIVTKRAGAIIISQDRARSSKKEIIPALKTLVEEKGLEILPWEGAQRLLDRIRFFVAHNGENTAGQWSDAALTTEIETWLAPFIKDDGGTILGPPELEAALGARLGWEHKAALDRLVPDIFVPPPAITRTTQRVTRGRRTLHIDYRSGEPLIRIRLQDCFGITGPCEVMGVPLVFHLLSPADRPIQVTRDLPGFWKGSYRDVRKEMRGRYPKHDWPEM
ncbi:MAG: ATP-dependent helicase, partial [Treponema sp.]|nr:ATP-dependent helicase [Treponema sp.]